MITIAFVDDAQGLLGVMRTQTADVTLDSNYPTGGYAIDGHMAGVGIHLVGVTEVGSNTIGTLYVVHFDSEAGTLFVSGTITTVTEDVDTLNGSTNLAGTEGNADQAAGPTNSAAFLAETAFSVLAGTMTPTSQPDKPRNVVITIHNATGGALNLFLGTTTFTITGTDEFDNAQTETVALTSTSGNRSVAASKFRFIQGVKAFKTITTVTYDNAPAATLKGSLGPGSRIALVDLLQTPSIQDIVSADVDGTPLTISSTTTSAGGVDVPNNTINVGTITDGQVLTVDYNPTNEVANGTDLSGVVKRLLFMGQ